MKKTIIAAAALVAMVGCNKTLIEAPISEADYGYINLGVTVDDEMVITKGVTATDLDNYRICLYTVSGETATPYWTGKVIGEETVGTDGFITVGQAKANEAFWKVPAGSYKILVDNGAEASHYTDKGNVYVSDEESVTVFAGLPASVELECTPKNSKVSFIYNDSFSTVFNTEDLIVSVAERSISLTPYHMASDANLDSEKDNFDAAYFSASTEINWSITVATTATDAVAKTYQSKFTTTGSKWTIVTFSAGETDGTINVTITTNNDISETESITYTLNPTNQEVTSDQNN